MTSWRTRYHEWEGRGGALASNLSLELQCCCCPFRVFITQGHHLYSIPSWWWVMTHSHQPHSHLKKIVIYLLTHTHTYFVRIPLGRWAMDYNCFWLVYFWDRVLHPLAVGVHGDTDPPRLLMIINGHGGLASPSTSASSECQFCTTTNIDKFTPLVG